MALLDEIKPFIDGNGLLAPNLVPPGTMRGSDNGVLFTSELLIQSMLNSGVIDPVYIENIKDCIDSTHLLHRAPQDTTNDTSDDYYGILGMMVFLNINIKLRLPPLLWAQPLLWFLILLKNKSIFSHLLSPIAAIIIATSCMFTSVSDTSSRFLMWCAIKGAASRSTLCSLAAKIWFNRLFKDFGPEGMLTCAKIYFYRDNHPFSRYFKN